MDFGKMRFYKILLRSQVEHLNVSFTRFILFIFIVGIGLLLCWQFWFLSKHLSLWISTLTFAIETTILFLGASAYFRLLQKYTESEEHLTKSKKELFLINY